MRNLALSYPDRDKTILRT